MKITDEEILEAARQYSWSDKVQPNVLTTGDREREAFMQGAAYVLQKMESGKPTDSKAMVALRVCDDCYSEWIGNDRCPECFPMG